MRGNNIVNMYVIDSVAYRKDQLNKQQLSYINSIADVQKYNDLRQQILFERGDDVHATIKIYFPDQEMVVEFDAT
jgi:hypothetical protein